MTSVTYPLPHFLASCFVLSLPSATCAAKKPAPDGTKADRQPPMTAAETRAFMKRLLQYVEAHHLKKDDKSEQCGMVYEYFDTRRAGAFDQWVRGEALDTMHDGAWLASFKEKGYVPTGLGAGADWEHFSDSGAYAHLPAASAQWLLLLEGKNDWEQHKGFSHPTELRP